MQVSEKPAITFSLLDFGLRDESMNSMSIIEDVLDYARMADQMGFKRIWLAEHHVPDSMAPWYNPFPLLPLIAGMTKKIKTGIAGTQLHIHNPYHTALNYKLLANLFPDRIDLGLATGMPPQNIMEYFEQSRLTVHEKRAEVVNLLHNEDALVAEKELIIPPFKGNIPPIWFLTSSYNGLDEVLKYKVNFSRSLFHGSDVDFHKEKLTAFLQEYCRQYGHHPETTLAFSGSVHQTDEKAARIAEAANYKGISRINITGSIEKFKDTVQLFSEEYGYREFTFLNVARHPKDRRLALSLIQKVFNL